MRLRTYCNSMKSKILFVKISVWSIFVLSLFGCGQANDNNKIDKDTLVDSSAVEEYVAENDIAMTMRSIIDCISVGEPLDTADYNFNGVLTDGEGMPLYTDLQGNPGEWEIDVTSDKSVRIHNLYLGDLLPEHLTNYLTLSLNLTDSISANADMEDDEDTTTEIYHFESGDIRIQTRDAYAPNGLEGPLMSIVISSFDNVNG